MSSIVKLQYVGVHGTASLLMNHFQKASRQLDTLFRPRYLFSFRIDPGGGASNLQ